MKEHETLMGDKFRKAGFVSNEIMFQTAIALFLNNGGTIERAFALIEEAAEKMRAEGQPSGADKAGKPSPAHAQPNAGKGRLWGADNATVTVPDPAPNEAAGQRAFADKAIRRVPAASPQSREDGRTRIDAVAETPMPSSRDAKVSEAGRTLRAVRDKHKPGHSKRNLASIALVQATVAKSLFDTKLPDGRALREVSWAECPTLARNYRRMSRVLMAVHSHAVPADPSTTLDGIVNEEQLKEIFGAVEKFNDIH